MQFRLKNYRDTASTLANTRQNELPIWITSLKGSGKCILHPLMQPLMDSPEAIYVACIHSRIVLSLLYSITGAVSAQTNRSVVP